MSRLTRALGVRPDEARFAGLVALAFAAVEAGRGVGEVGVDTLVLATYGPAVLPYLFVALGVVGLIVTVAYGATLARIRSPRVIPAMLLLIAGVLVVERAIATISVGSLAPALWVSVYAAGALLVTVLWTVAGAVFNARQAKRLFPLVTSAAILGGFVGQLAAGPIARVTGAETLVVVEAALVAVAAFLLNRLGRRVRPGAAQRGSTSFRAALLGGATHVARTPLLRLVAMAYLLFAVLMFSVSFPFLAAMSTAFPNPADLATALGLFAAAVTASSFVVSALLANRLYAAFGVASVALALPLVYLGGFGLWLVRFTAATAVAVRFAQQVAQRGLSNSAWSAFFSVVPAARRGQVMAFMDGVPGQLGTVLSGLLLLFATRLAQEQLFLVGLVTAAVTLVVVLLIRRTYAATLVATLREGLAEQVLEGGPGIAALGRDPQVIAGLSAAGASPRPGERRLAAELLGDLHAAEAVPILERLATDTDPAVRRAAVRSLGIVTAPVGSAGVLEALGDPDADVRIAAVRGVAKSGDHVDELTRRLAGDPSPAVRGELAVALAGHGGGPNATAIVRELLERRDDSAASVAGLDALARMDGSASGIDLRPFLGAHAAAVRAAAIRALAANGTRSTDLLVAALDDDAREVRAAASEALRSDPAATDEVVATLRNGSGQAQEAALAALDGRADEVRDDLVAWAAGEVERATALRSRATALETAMSSRGAADAPATNGGTRPAASSAAFLASVLRRRESAITARLLAAVAVLGAPEATGLLRRCLHAADAETRAQAIEALDAIGDARLGRSLVRLLDSDGTAASGVDANVDAIARSLADDPDPWVRALALRTLTDEADGTRRWAAAKASADRDAVVRLAVGPGGIDAGEGGGQRVPESRQTLGEIDRMLILRRVSLFEALAPEDLQRIATAASERTYAGGEALVREGELGDELVVIVEGTVRVIHTEPQGEHVVRSYGPGDHIGELAVLREGLRSATVEADEPGVRGLVIGGEALAAILRERPDAAMAMLSTLADRLATTRNG